MSRSRSASVSGTSPFAPPPASNDLSASADILSALSLEGRDTRTISRAGTPSVWRTPSAEVTATAVQTTTAAVELTFKEAVVPQVLGSRPPCRVRRAGAPRFRSSPGSSSVTSRGEGNLPLPKGDGLNERSLRAATLSPLSIGGGGSKAEPGVGGPQHPFDEPRFAGGLMAAGYLEMFDISRKKIKTRFSHGLGKENLKEHLSTFLENKDLKSRGEYMVRFVGQQDVHSPFVHIYTTTLLLDTSTVKTVPPSLSTSDTLTTWTHLRTIGNASHWSAKKPKFWPLRVVLEGPSSTDVVPSADEPPSPVQHPSRSNRKGRRDDEDLLSPATEQNTKANSAFVNHPKREVIEPSSPPRPRLTLPIPPSSTAPARGTAPMTPTILASVRQLGVAVANSIPPTVQTAVQTQVAALRTWMGKGGDAEEDEDEDEEERRERRRVRRQARREREEMKRMPSRRDRERSRSREREPIDSREDREARREEKERRREERRRARG